MEQALYRLEVKLPSENGQTRTQVIRLEQDLLEFATRYDFPNTGNTRKLYVATDENKIYRWSESGHYTVVGSDYNDIEIIDCGGATNGNT